jgi:hypothetical protein
MTLDELGSFSGNFAGRTRHPERGSVKGSQRGATFTIVRHDSSSLPRKSLSECPDGEASLML